MKKYFKIMILTIVLISFFSCKKSNEIMNKFRLSRTAEIFNDSLLVYSTINDSVVIENIRNEKTIFSQKINDKESIRPQPVLDINNNLYATFSEDKLTCIDINTNVFKWEYSAEEKINFIKSINENIVIISIRQFGVIALNAKTGKKIYQLYDEDFSTCPSTFITSFINDNELIYIPDFQCNTISAFKLSNGKKLWGYGYDNYGPCKPVIYGDFIFCGITGDSLKDEGRIFILSKKTGKIIFQDTTIAFDITTNPVLYMDKIIYMSHNGKLMQFDTTLKKSKILSTLNNKKGLCGGGLQLVGDYIYFDNCNFKVGRFNLKSRVLDELGKRPKGLNLVYQMNNKIKFVY